MTSTPSRVWHGVNLGNWLLLEKWIQPTLFEPAPAANDEHALCAALGDRAEAYMRKHRETYITDDDFAWMASYGIDAVRIPFGYWLVEKSADVPFVGGIEYLDRALDLCRKHKIGAVLDLHGAPGHQSGEHHTGRSGFFQWHLDASYRARTLDVLEAVAQRYRDHDGLAAISCLNEPHYKVESSMLLEFYHAACERIRKHLSPERAPVIIEAHPHSRLVDFHGKLQTLGCKNVITDIHPYQSFYETYERMTVAEHLAFPMNRAYPRLSEFAKGGQLVIGEWSLVMGDHRKPLYVDMPDHLLDVTMRAFATSQLALFEMTTAGWFFWTYKTERHPQWSLRTCVERGWFPASLAR